LCLQGSRDSPAAFREKKQRERKQKGEYGKCKRIRKREREGRKGMTKEERGEEQRERKEEAESREREEESERRAFTIKHCLRDINSLHIG